MRVLTDCEVSGLSVCLSMPETNGFRGRAEWAVARHFFLVFSKCLLNVFVTLLLHGLKSEVFIRGGVDNGPLFLNFHDPPLI